MADTNTRQGKRTPVTLKIKFKSETLEQFIERYAVDVSQGGIFIRTKDPLAVGTQMKFEFQLRDASPLIAGEGTVVWTRENDPSRPAIAPGMGVRFDRLADGSQGVLEKILAEKAKQAPSRSGSQTAPGDKGGGVFMDEPTRVAPAPLQEALGVRGHDRNRADSEQTPLPKPMPFHSDAEDFEPGAFDEATKIRSLDDLALQSVGLGTGDDPMSEAANATKIMPADELSVRRQAGRDDATHTDPPLAAPPEEVRIPTLIDRDSAPGLPSPPAVEPARAQRMLDTTPSPRTDPPARQSQPSTPPLSTHGGGSGTPTPPPPSESEPERTQPGIGSPKSTSQSMPKAAAASEVASRPAAAATRPAAPSRPSSAPIILGILVVVAAAMGAVYWFVLRDPGTSSNVVDTGSGSAVTPGSGSAGAMTGSDSGSAVAMSGSGSGSDAGSGSAGAMTGSDSGSAAVVPSGPTVDTVITTAAKGATVEIIGTEMKGPSPFTAKLEKDKPYKARISAAGFTVSEIDVKGGQRTTAKLVLKPRVVSVTTDPAGASIFVDNTDTGKVTPDSVTLTSAQAGRQRVRIGLRRSGYRGVDITVEAAAFKDAGNRMTNEVQAKLVVQQVVRPPNNASGAGSGSAATGTDSGSASSGTGSAAPTGTGSATPTPAPAPAPTPAPPASGGGTPTELK